MMTRTARPCPKPRCPELQPCPRAGHTRIPFEGATRTGVALYNTRRWRQESREYLAGNPYCVAENGTCSTLATVVDHRIPHRGDEALFWDRFGNWQAMCRAHHNAKTGRETRERIGQRR